ncbi:hypothetical protein ACFO5X_02585 [Seohaeicola nanhaiensis]|uniref:Uncharacterized protein n=1 Tax=Seohaeicola nanhaiensis TaxID=1387282 RepID=A0ABV9KBX5_9RHOB
MSLSTQRPGRNHTLSSVPVRRDGHLLPNHMAGIGPKAGIFGKNSGFMGLCHNSLTKIRKLMIFRPFQPGWQMQFGSIKRKKPQFGRYYVEIFAATAKDPDQRKQGSSSRDLT